MEVTNDFFQFAYTGNKETWYNKLDRLANLALPETWNYRTEKPEASNKRTPILENYVLHTFKRLAYEFNQCESEAERNLIFSQMGDKLCFNTGLFSKTYEVIYACFRENRNAEKEPWFLVGFSDTSDPFFDEFLDLPRRAQYFSKISELIYDTSVQLRLNTAHILNNPKNIERLPTDLRYAPNLTTLFNGAVDLAKKKVEANYKAAVPQYYDDQICFLLPICLTNTETADLSLAVKWHNGYYTGHTCLTLDMAYNNARLIACPNSEWLNP